MADISKITMSDGSVYSIKDEYARQQIGADYVIPQMYGAVGDGETDDIEAFEKMLAEVPKNVYIPSGRYYISKSIKIPNGVNIIKGAGKDVTKIIGAKTVFNTNDAVIYNLQVSDLTITNGGGNSGFMGGFRYCNFVDLIIWECKYGFNLGLSSWSNTFTRCNISHNENGIRSTSESFNNNIFRDCWIENNDIGFYCNKGGCNVVFDGCLIQNNEIGFKTTQMRSVVIRDSYIENNGCIYSIHIQCYDSTWTIENCYIFSNKTTNGWFLNLPAIASVPGQSIPMFNIEKCYIRHSSANYKPFAFYKADANGEYGQVAVNINECTFYHQPNTYMDLFDHTNCSSYGDGYNRLPIKTDLPYYATDTCKWFLRSGNGSKYMGADRYFELCGYLVSEQANAELSGETTVAIPAIVGKVENAYLGGTAVMETIDATTEENTLSPAYLYSVTIGGLRFDFPNGEEHKMREKLYVTGLKY